MNLKFSRELNMSGGSGNLGNIEARHVFSGFRESYCVYFYSLAHGEHPNEELPLSPGKSVSKIDSSLHLRKCSRTKRHDIAVFLKDASLSISTLIPTTHTNVGNKLYFSIKLIFENAIFPHKSKLSAAS